MNLFKKLFNTHRLKPNLEPLDFQQSAISKITEHLQSHPQSIFQIRVEYKEKKYIVQVGFDKNEAKSTQFSYPVPVFLTPKDELFLRGFSIEFHEKENAFFVLPNIQVEAFDTPNQSIKKFFINRFVVSPNSDLQEIILEKNKNQEKSLPYFVREIFSFPFIVSFFAKENWIQIEFEKSKEIQKYEQQVGEYLAEYFETCSYPLLYKNEELQVEYFRSAP